MPFRWSAEKSNSELRTMILVNSRTHKRAYYIGCVWIRMDIEGIDGLWSIYSVARFNESASDGVQILLY